MNTEIVLRIRSPDGQNRLTVRPIDTFGEVMMQVKDLVIIGSTCL